MDSISGYVHFVVRSVHVLKFSIEWDHKRRDPVGRERKAEYVEGLYRSLEKDNIAAIERAFMGKRKREKLSALKRKFVAKHEKVIASRNHIRKLYRKVS
jgi:hypothetical protein